MATIDLTKEVLYVVAVARTNAGGAPDSWGFASGEEIASGLYADRRLGGGKRYEAYVGFHQRLYSPVVVMVLRPGLVDDAQSRRGLAREVETLRGIDHPVIIRCFDADLDAPRPHVVLEHVEGPRLSTLLRRYGRLPTEQSLPLALQLVSALHYLDGVGLMHLDIKPSNLIMAGPPRLIDFSIAAPVERAAKLTRPIGTRTYLAPEQADDRRGPITPAADTWGLGTVLYEAVSGRPAFPRDSPHDHPQLFAPPAPLPDDIPAGLADAIAACLSPDARSRPAPAEVGDALEDLVAALPSKIVLSRLRPGLR